MLTNPKLKMRSRITFKGRLGKFQRDVGQGYYKLQRASSHSDSSPRSLDRAHYKLLRCARKNVAYEEKTSVT